VYCQCYLTYCWQIRYTYIDQKLQFTNTNKQYRCKHDVTWPWACGSGLKIDPSKMSRSFSQKLSNSRLVQKNGSKHGPLSCWTHSRCHCHCHDLALNCLIFQSCWHCSIQSSHWWQCKTPRGGPHTSLEHIRTAVSGKRFFLKCAEFFVHKKFYYLHSQDSVSEYHKLWKKRILLVKNVENNKPRVLRISVPVLWWKALDTSVVTLEWKWYMFPVVWLYRYSGQHVRVLCWLAVRLTLKHVALISWLLLVSSASHLT